MATLENTRESRGQDTLLSKRIFNGNTKPTFHSSFARWSNVSSTDARLSFDITWEGPPCRDNAFYGYSILVSLGKERLDGDLVLLIRPELEDLALATVVGDAYIDACDHEKIPSAAHVLGRVIAERQFLTPMQLIERKKNFKRVDSGRFPALSRELDVTDRIDSALVRAQAEIEQVLIEVESSRGSGQITTIAWEMERAMKESPAYLRIRDKFREDDAQQDHSIDRYGFEDDVNDSLREAFALMFRAGQYAGPEHFMLDPEPSDQQGVEGLIKSTLDEVFTENNRDHGVPSTSPLPLSSLDICTMLIDCPTYHAVRDEFRKDDAEDDHWSEGHPLASDPSQFDFTLRMMLTDWFRAGMLASRTFAKPMPAPVAVGVSAIGD